MKEFNHSVRLNRPLDESLHQAFTDMLNTIQASMARIALEHSQVQERTERVTEENRSLRSQNQKLREELQQFQRQLAAGAPVPAAVPAAAPAAGAWHGQQQMSDTEEAFMLQRSISIHEAPVHSVAMLNREGSRVVATASWDATVKLYNLQTEEVIRTLGDVDPGEEGKMGGLYAVAFAKTAPDILGCTSCDRSVYLWNHATGKLLSKLTGHQDEVNGIDFHSSQQVMCTASDDCKVIVWDFQEGITLRTLDKHTKAVYGCTFLGLENQYYVATCCFDQKTRVFDMRDKQVVALLPMHTDDVIGIDYSSAKQLLATGSDDGLIGIWDSRTWKLQQSINTKEDANIPDNEVKRIAFSPDGALLAAACSSGRVLVYDVSTCPAKQVAQLGGHTDCVFDVTWGHCPQTNAKTLVSASHDFTCRYWREMV